MKTTFRKTDLIYSLIIGEAVAWLAFFIIKNLELIQLQYLWLILAILVPIAAAVCLYITFIIGKKIPVAFQAGKFLVVGISNTLIDWGVLNILILLTGIVGGVFYAVFKGLSFVTANINSFAWNKFWTFSKKETDKTGKEFAQFLVVSLCGLGINIAIASLIVNVLHPPAGTSPKMWATVGAAAASAFSMLWNFLGYKFIVFKKESPGPIV